LDPTATSHDVPAQGAEADLLRTIAAGTANVVGRAFFRSLVRHVADALDADVVFLAAFVDEGCERARVLAAHARPGIEVLEGHQFDTAGCPAELIADRDVVALPNGALAAYPSDPLVAGYGLDGYLAIVLRGSDGARLGYVGVHTARRLEPSDGVMAALQIFASRAAAEIERGRNELELREREAEVAASRARVLSAADEERRRIGRDLHDGVQQRLASLTLLVKMIESDLEPSQTRAASLAHRARDEAAEALKEVQDLARGLHPAVLMQEGLRAALETLGQRVALPVRIFEMPERRLPEVLEVTVYYVVSEAIANALKHAQASELRVAVTQQGSALLASVADDGVGGADPEVGSGLRGVIARIESLGGTLDIVSPPGEGTRLEVSIPLGRWRDAREPFLEFGHEDDDGLGEELIATVLGGERNAAVSLARDWDLEGGPPRPGQLLPVMDYRGRRHGTIEVQRMGVIPFGEIGQDVVECEVTRASSVEEWRAIRRNYYDGCRDKIAMLLGEPGWRLTDEEPMVVVWFKVAEEGTTEKT
jgi:signal transduction histidine kinase/uncharacterized protein YhfF